MTTIYTVPTAPTLTTDLAGGGDDDELVHLYCCEDENVGLCGTDLTGVPVTSEIDRDCVVCVDLEAAGWPCPTRAVCAHRDGQGG